MAAEQDFIDAQTSLGFLCQYGRGVPENDEEAVKWYRLAAEQGDARGQRHLGLMYERGQGVPQSYEEAGEWYRLAEDSYDRKVLDALDRVAGESEELNVTTALGRMNEEGIGFQQNSKMAVSWYLFSIEESEGRNKDALDGLGRMYEEGEYEAGNLLAHSECYKLAAEQGHPVGQTFLALMYLNGLGVPQNSVEAYKWFRLATDQGYAEAHYQVGSMYLNGHGVQRSNEEAVKWYRMAAEGGNSHAEEQLDEMHY